ncbi:MAG: plasmid pRiA4b ORF-3 family protein [Acidobacteria bacterium]|nr:plasmid pRiA4b ORF-3 family protein [Acidobacteriota bacterium]
MDIALSSKHQRILQGQAISDDEPGRVLRDFETLLDFVGERAIKVSGIHQILPMNVLAELNARLSRPLRIGLKRPQQKSYPHINGLYLLLRASGLSLIRDDGKQPVLSLDRAALSSWRSLNATERYFTLLEAWLVRGNGEIIGEHDPLGSLFKCSTFMERIPDKGLKVAGDRQTEQFTIPYSIGTYNLALLDLFGCMVIEEGPPEEGKGWVITRIKRTVFGEALIKLLSRHKLAEMEVLLEEDGEFEEATAFGTLQPVLQPYFPEWRKNLSLPEAVMIDSLYIIKVSLDAKTWRRIAIPARLMLDDLSDTILRAFNFDNGHLYEFSYRNRFGATAHIHHPYTEEAPSTDEVAIGEILLRPGASMEYLFDFGDQWRFDVKLEGIDPADARIKNPKILERHGQAPPQYPNLDEDEE